MQDRVDELRETLAAAQQQALQVEGPAAAALGSVILALQQVVALLEELRAQSPGAAAPLSPAGGPAGRAVGVHDVEELTGTAGASAATGASAAPLDNLAEAGGEAPPRGV